jgi:TonB family protein
VSEVLLTSFESFLTRASWRPLAALGFSVLAHVALSRSMAALPPPAPPREPPPSFEIEMPAPEEPPPVQPEPPPPAPEPTPAPAPKAPPPPAVAKEVPPTPTPAPTTEAPPSAPAEPGFLTAGESSDGVGLPAGQLGVVGAQRAPTPAPVSRPAPPAPPAPPRQVSFRDLTEKPRPPRLDDALRRNYPSGARLAGRAGTARVVLSITRAGKVTDVRLVQASDTEFGDACRRTLLGTAWSPPLDQEGRAVGTLMPYECRFRVTP